MTNGPEYLEIVNWGDHLHPDLTRKVKPPFRWIKLQTENLDMLGDLSLREYGAYCRILNLSALTNNQTAFKTNWIKRRTGITPKDLQKLKNRGLIKITNSLSTVEESQQNQANDQETASDSQADLQQASRLDGNRKGLDTNGIEGDGPAGIRPTGRQPKFEELTRACDEAGVSGSDWNGIANLIETKFQFSPTKKQLNTIQRQLNDRAGK